MPDPISLVVLGLGDALRSDDGLGLAVVDRLQRGWVVPAAVHLAADRLPAGPGKGHAALLVDAVRADLPPGAFVRLEGLAATDAIRDRMPEALAALLEGGRRDDRGALILLGLVPASITAGRGLSPRVESGLEGLVRRVVLEARHLGHHFRPRLAAARAAA